MTELTQYEIDLVALNQRIKCFPLELHVYKLRGNLHARCRNFDKALADYSFILMIESCNLSALVNRGNVYTQMGKYTLALKDYESALILDDKDPDIYHNRGKLFMEMGCWDLAEKDLMYAQNCVGHHSQTMATVAELYFSTDRKNRGINAYFNLQKQFPDVSYPRLKNLVEDKGMDFEEAPFQKDGSKKLYVNDSAEPKLEERRKVR